MTGKTYTHEELAKAEYLECFLCGAKVENDTATLKLPKGWRNANLHGPKPKDFIGRFLCPKEPHKVWEKLRNNEGRV